LTEEECYYCTHTPTGKGKKGSIIKDRWIIRRKNVLSEMRLKKGCPVSWAGTSHQNFKSGYTILLSSWS